MKNSADSRYFLTLSYLCILIGKVLTACQYLYSVPNHRPILFFPPFSVILAAFDFILLFVFFKIWDRVNKFKISGILNFALFLSLELFCLYDLPIFQYFRGFTNLGLARFLVYDSREIASYYAMILNPFLIGIIFFYIFLLVIALFFVLKKKFYIIKPLSYRVLSVLLIVNFAFFCILRFLPFEEKVGLEKSPVFEYFSTRILSSYYLDVKKKAEPAEYPKIADDDEVFPKIDFDYSQTKGKNVIFVILESTAFEKTPLGGDKESKFSFLDDLSKKSISFVSHRTVFPATTRSLLSLFCSTYSGTDYASITKTDAVFDCGSIFDTFEKNGYSTSFFSPVLLDFDDFGNSEILKKINYVFEPSEVLKNGAFKRKFGTTTAIEEEIVQEHFFKHIQEVTSKNKPFFALYFPYWTHAPYEVPFEDTGKLSSLERYYRSQEYLNEKMKEFLNRLEKENIMENSIVIVTSDHGEAFGRKVGNFIHPNYLWDENLHVPFMIYAKGVTDAEPKTVTNPTTVLDVAPTIAALVGIEPESSWNGSNMFDGITKPVFIYTRAMNLFSGILDGNRKFFFNHVTGENYYFDLKNDPLENNDLADTLDDNKLKQLRNYIEYKNFELNDKAINGKKTK